MWSGGERRSGWPSRSGNGQQRGHAAAGVAGVSGAQQEVLRACHGDSAPAMQERSAGVLLSAEPLPAHSGPSALSHAGEARSQSAVHAQAARVDASSSSRSSRARAERAAALGRELGCTSRLCLGLQGARGPAAREAAALSGCRGRRVPSVQRDARMLRLALGTERPRGTPAIAPRSKPQQAPKRAATARGIGCEAMACDLTLAHASAARCGQRSRFRATRGS
jgi:hypothetical protein